MSQNNVIKELFDKPIGKKLWVAPMAGVTDRPFRSLCKYFGAGHAVSEMMTSDQTLRMSKKSLYRANFDGELAPISAQIAGSDPKELAELHDIRSQMVLKLWTLIWGVLPRKSVISWRVLHF